MATVLNLSIATVSRALKNDPVGNKKTREKTFALAEKLGHRTNHFARNLINHLKGICDMNHTNTIIVRSE